MINHAYTDQSLIEHYYCCKTDYRCVYVQCIASCSLPSSLCLPSFSLRASLSSFLSPFLSLSLFLSSSKPFFSRSRDSSSSAAASTRRPIYFHSTGCFFPPPSLFTDDITGYQGDINFFDDSKFSNKSHNRIIVVTEFLMILFSSYIGCFLFSTQFAYV